VSTLSTPILRSKRFTLRPLVRADADAFFPTLSDPENCKFLTRAEFKSVEELGDWLCDPDWNARSWAAIEDATQELVARVVAIPVAEEVAEIGYITVAGRTGQGIASECTERLVKHLFEAEGHHRLTANTDPRNGPSNALLRKLGFRQEAHLRESIKTHIGWCDEYWWGLLAREWQAR
jgi:RimJ/RimL family protein N-acetyltransferase